MKKLRMRVDELQVESFETADLAGLARGTVRARACSASEEGESICCPDPYTEQVSCLGSCLDTCQYTCECTGGGWCPTHHWSACPAYETCVAETCAC